MFFLLISALFERPKPASPCGLGEYSSAGLTHNHFFHRYNTQYWFAVAQ
ncbi:MAG: hypothetical protein R2788_23775 [Saprospiraceae bacterium]